jgi:hypothetical protein
VFFEDAFLAENPDLEVKLELRIYKGEENYRIGETYIFTLPQEEPPVESIRLMQATLELESIVYLNIYTYPITNEGVNPETNMGLLVWTGDEDAYSENAFLVGNENTTAYHGAKAYSDRCKLSTAGIVAKELGDEHYMRAYVQLADGSYEYSKVIYYGPQTFATNQLKTTSKADDNLKKLCVAMLDYAAAAQVSFDYKTDDLANNVTVEGVNLDDYRTAYVDTMLTPVVGADASIVGDWARDRVNCPSVVGSLILEGIITNNFSFKFTPEIMSDVQSAKFLFWDAQTYSQLLASGAEFSEENATVVKEMVLDSKDGYYKAGYDKTAVKNLGDSIYVCGVVTTSDGSEYVSGVISYSGHTWISNILKRTDATANDKNLAKYLAVYSDAARTNFAK